MTNKEFVNKLLNIVNNYNTVYAYGTFGQKLTTSLINQKEKQYPNWYTTSRKNSLQNLVGKKYFAFDCVGLIKGVLWGWNGSNTVNGGAKYESNGVPDINANTMINKCSNVSSNLSNIKIGELLWMSGHVGIYYKDNQVIECSPAFKNKVQITAVGNIGSKSGYNTRTWTNHGKLRFIEYIGGEDVEPEKPTGNSLVKSWQIVMNKVYHCGLDVDGSYGPKSKEAAKEHQLYKKKLVINRIRNDYVRWLQNRLNELGYHLAVDGSFWNDTNNAVRSFQRNRGLKVDGYVGSLTVKELLK